MAWMDKVLRTVVLGCMLSGCTPAGQDPVAGTERAALDVGHQSKWRELRVSGTTDLPDGAVLSYRVTHALTDEIAPAEWPAKNLITDGTAIVQAGQYWADLNTTYWPAGTVRIRVEFPVVPQPGSVQSVYGEFGERLEGDNVSSLGSSKVLTAEHVFEWTR